jgi:hypothetical protein
MDVIGLQKAMDKFNDVSIPKLEASIDRLIATTDKHFDQDLKDMFELLRLMTTDMVRQLSELKTESIGELLNGMHSLIDRINGSSLSVPGRKS